MERVLITGGAGDVIAISTFLTQEERESIKYVYYATRSRDLVNTFLKYLFPNLYEYIIVQDQFSSNEEYKKPELRKYFSVNRKSDLVDIFKTKHQEFITYYDEIVDLSLAEIVKQVVSGSRKYNLPLSLITAKLGDEVELPERPYILVQPFSENLTESERDFSFMDYITLKSFAEVNELDIVIVNQASVDTVPIQGKNVHNYTNKLSFLQSLELCKDAMYYIGTGSSISVFASKCIPSDRLIIKATRRVINEGSFYYAPYSSRDVCFSSIEEGLRLKGLI